MTGRRIGLDFAAVEFSDAARWGSSGTGTGGGVGVPARMRQRSGITSPSSLMRSRAFGDPFHRNPSQLQGNLTNHLREGLVHRIFSPGE